MAMTPNPGDRLTEREKEALSFLAQDMTYEEVALKMAVTFSTARSHIKNAYGKLGVRSAVGAILALQKAERETKLDKLLTSFVVADRLNGDTQDVFNDKMKAILDFIDDDRVREELGW